MKTYLKILEKLNVYFKPYTNMYFKKIKNIHKSKTEQIIKEIEVYIFIILWVEKEC